MCRGDQLEQAEFDYELALLKAGADKYVSESRAVSDAREDLSEARANANKIKNAESVIKAAEADLANKQARYDELYKHLKELESASGDTEEIKKLKELLAEAEDKAEAAKKYYDSLAATDPAKEEAEKTWEAWEAAKADYQNKLNNLLNGTTSSGSGSGEEEGGTVIPPVQHDNEKYEELYNQLVAAGAEVTAAEVYLNSVQEKYGNISSGSYEAALAAVEQAERAYDAAREALQNAIAGGEIDEKTEVKLISKIIKNSSTFLPSQNIYSNGKVFSFLEEKLMLIIGNKKNKYLYTLFDFANLKFSEEMEIKVDSPLMLTNEEKIILEFFKKSIKFEDLLNAYN